MGKLAIAMLRIPPARRSSASCATRRANISSRVQRASYSSSLGHGIGLNVHEYPRVNKISAEILTDGMVFSDEPGVYVAGEYGIRIEDTVTLENGKIRSFMSKTDKKLIVL